MVAGWSLYVSFSRASTLMAAKAARTAPTNSGDDHIVPSPSANQGAQALATCFTSDSGLYCAST